MRTWTGYVHMSVLVKKKKKKKRLRAGRVRMEERSRERKWEREEGERERERERERAVIMIMLVGKRPFCESGWGKIKVPIRWNMIVFHILHTGPDWCQTAGNGAAADHGGHVCPGHLVAGRQSCPQDQRRRNYKGMSWLESTVQIRTPVADARLHSSHVGRCACACRLHGLHGL